MADVSETEAVTADEISVEDIQALDSKPTFELPRAIRPFSSREEPSWDLPESGNYLSQVTSSARSALASSDLQFFPREFSRPVLRFSFDSSTSEMEENQDSREEWIRSKSYGKCMENDVKDSDCGVVVDGLTKDATDECESSKAEDGYCDSTNYIVEEFSDTTDIVEKHNDEDEEEYMSCKEVLSNQSTNIVEAGDSTENSENDAKKNVVSSVIDYEYDFASDIVEKQNDNDEDEDEEYMSCKEVLSNQSTNIVEAGENSENSKKDVISSVIDCEFDFTSYSLPVPSLEDLANSDYIHNRQLAARKILESLQQAGGDGKELHSVVSVICKLSKDEEAMVRLELMQHIPSLALYSRNSVFVQVVIRQQLLPYTVKLLSDPQVQPPIRTAAQSALVVFLDNNLIDEVQLTEWICPLISQLVVCESNLEEQRVDDVSLMTKVVPFVGKEITVKFFLEPYVSLCCDPAFGIRKMCALGFGTLCKIVGVEKTELLLVPAFLNLCNDEMWGVRKACVDVFVDVAKSVTPKTRREVLPLVFDNFLTDNSNYVKFGAYQNLGSFIYSFADPTAVQKESDYKQPVLVVKKMPELRGRVKSCTRKTRYDLTRNNWQPNEKSDPSLAAASKDGHFYFHVDNENLFNNFQFWRVPLPEVQLDIDFEDGKATNIHVRAKVQGAEEAAASTSEIKVHIDSNQPHAESSMKFGGKKMLVQTACINTFSSQEHQSLLDNDSEVLRSSFKESVLTFNVVDDVLEISESVDSSVSSIEESSWLPEKKDIKMTPYDQDIVPPALLLSFISAVSEPTYGQYLERSRQYEDEKTGYIAYSFPAVAFTLGPKYWPCIRDTYKILARDEKWAVRRTIASSLHDLAVILGYDIIMADLLPIFLDLLKDVDDVRMRLLQHFSEFLKHLSQQDKLQFLPLIEEFTTVDNDKNWRFRCAVAEQFKETAYLYDPVEIPTYFIPVASKLLYDRVSAVRMAAVELMAVLIKLLRQDYRTESFLFETVLDGLDSLYRQSQKWILRQTYVRLCEELAKNASISKSEYIERIEPQLLSLAWDKVPNVRLAVVRCLAVTLVPKDWVPSLESSPSSHQLLLNVLESLNNDVDNDVRYFANLFNRAFRKC